MRHVRCLYCHALILEVEFLSDYTDVFVLYAHKACHSERRCVDPPANTCPEGDCQGFFTAFQD
jgi:hypothetical protein